MNSIQRMQFEQKILERKVRQFEVALAQIEVIVRETFEKPQFPMIDPEKAALLLNPRRKNRPRGIYVTRMFGKRRKR